MPFPTSRSRSPSARCSRVRTEQRTTRRSPVGSPSRVGRRCPTSSRSGPRTTPPWTASPGDCSAFSRVSLDLPADWFDAGCRNPTSTLSAVHYPGTDGAAPQALRAGAHSDYGTLTILHKQPGADDLEVRLPDGRWSRQRPGEDVFIVNTGDLLAQWDQRPLGVDRAPGSSCPSRDRGRACRSASSHQPDADCLVEALPSCVSADRPVRYEPVRAGEHLAGQVGRASTSRPAPDDPADPRAGRIKQASGGRPDWPRPCACAPRAPH